MVTDEAIEQAEVEAKINAHRKAHASHLEDIQIGKLVPSPSGQRRFVPSWADHLASILELEKIGYPVVNKRDGAYYIIDGQHRVAALKIWGFDDDEVITCEVFSGLSEEEEAEMFLGRNEVKVVHTVDRFEVGVRAGRELEKSIDTLVRAHGVTINRAKVRGRGDVISATAALKTIVNRQGLIGLGRTIRVLQGAYGNHALEANLLHGVSLFLHRYGDKIDDDALVERLADVKGGLNGLLGPAEKTHFALNQPRTQCIAAELELIYNKGQPARQKLAPWWSE